MKKYRLKKWYPTLPKDWEVGMEVGLGDYMRMFYQPCNVKYINLLIEPEQVKNNPEFWEEVVEKDYEILSFKCKDNSHLLTLRENGNYFLENDCRFDPNGYLCGLSESYHLYGNYEIYSVKRLSDGEVFTVGDRVHSRFTVDINSWKNCFIDSFVIKNGKMKFNVIENDTKGLYPLESLKPYKNPLFTTEDGVDIFLGDKVFGVDRNLKVFEFDALCKNDNEYFKRFSTKEAAEEYIFWNKKNLSLKDVFGVYPLTKKQSGTMTKHAQELIDKAKKI